jgi:hypothetical protein
MERLGYGDAEVGKRFDDPDMAKTEVFDFTLHCLLILIYRPMSAIYVFRCRGPNRVCILLIFGINDRYSA